jgi:23S rRNA pseudouridine1911/1915/1917 synthase
MQKDSFIYFNHTLPPYKGLTLVSIIAKKDMRLDMFLTDTLKQSRSQVRNFIKKVGININGKLTYKSGYALKVGDNVTYNIPKPKLSSKYSIDFDIDVIYEDEDVLIINKPPHLTVHPAPSVKEPTLVEWLKYKGIELSNLSGETREGIVHRIDKQTSGALVIAKNNYAHKFLAKQLEDKSMGRYYIAIIDQPLKDDIVIDRPISRNPRNRLKMLASERGKSAKSSLIKLSSSIDSRYELIAIKLFTGRTHQIRAHLESISRHILGDERYGFKSKKDTIARVMLHAYTIYFTHPKDSRICFYQAPLFLDMQKILNRYFDNKDLDEKLAPTYIYSRFNTLPNWM